MFIKQYGKGFSWALRFSPAEFFNHVSLFVFFLQSSLCSLAVADKESVSVQEFCQELVFASLIAFLYSLCLSLYRFHRSDDCEWLSANLFALRRAVPHSVLRAEGSLLHHDLLSLFDFGFESGHETARAFCSEVCKLVASVSSWSNVGRDR